MAHTMSEPAEIRKKLFQSPIVEGDRLADNSTTLTLMSRLQIEHGIELHYKAVQKDDVHEQSLKQLRQKVKTLPDDDWRYPSVEKLIGFH